MHMVKLEQSTRQFEGSIKRTYETLTCFTVPRCKDPDPNEVDTDGIEGVAVVIFLTSTNKIQMLFTVSHHAREWTISSIIE